MIVRFAFIPADPFKKKKVCFYKKYIDYRCSHSSSKSIEMQSLLGYVLDLVIIIGALQYI